MKIGVFDSGLGGKAMADKLQELLPEATILRVDDHEHVPYGDRSNEEIIYLTDAAIQPLLKEQCDAIVIACNTATAIAIDALRAKYPDMRFVGIEPMIKPAAAQSRNKHIAVFATPATLASPRYKQLKSRWANDVIVDEPDCRSWATMIEQDMSDQVRIEEAVDAAINNGADFIVLACTHYHWLKDRAVRAAGARATVLEPSDAIAQRIQSILTPKTTTN